MLHAMQCVKLYAKLTVKNKKSTTRIRNLINDVSKASVLY